MVFVALFVVTAVASSDAPAQVRNDAAYAAIVNHETESLELAIRSGLDPNAVLYLPQSPGSINALELAIRAKNEDAALLLLDHGARPPNSARSLERAEFLVMAAEQNMPKLLERLMAFYPEYLASVSTEGHPLPIAAAAGSVESIPVLLENLTAARSSQDRERVLIRSVGAAMIAPPQSATEVLNLVIDAGVDLSYAPYLAGAAKLCRADALAVFVKRGLDVQQSFEGKSARDFAVDCLVADEADTRVASDDGVAILRILSDAGVDACDQQYVRALPPSEQGVLTRRYPCR